MRILFDHGTPSGVAEALIGHEVTEAIDRGWDKLSNGALLEIAEAEGFELVLTTDKRIRYQQNLTGRKIALVVAGELDLARAAPVPQSCRSGSECLHDRQLR